MCTSRCKCAFAHTGMKMTLCSSKVVCANALMATIFTVTIHIMYLTTIESFGALKRTKLIVLCTRLMERTYTPTIFPADIG